MDVGLPQGRHSQSAVLPPDKSWKTKSAEGAEVGMACGSQFPLGTHLSAQQNIGDLGGSKMSLSSQAHAHLPQSRSTVRAAEEAQVPPPSTKPPLDPQPLSSRPPFLRSVWGVTLMSAQRLGSRAGHLVSHPSPGPPREQLHNDHLRSAPMVWTVPAVPSSVLEGLNSIQENTFKALDQLHKRTSVTFLQPHRTTGKEEAWGWAGCHGC